MIIKPSSRIGDVKAYYFVTKLAEIEAMNKRGDNVLNMGIGSPDLAPHHSVIDALKNAAAAPDANKYQSYKGLSALRSAFATHYSEVLDSKIDADTEVLPLLGSKEGIMHIAMSFLGAGDEVLVPNPGYPSYRVTTELAGATAKSYDLEESMGWLPDLEALSSQDLSKVKLMWINYPNMPTGAKATRNFFEKLVAFGLRHKILICHDNPYNMVLNEEPMSILSVKGAKECCLELCSLSKAYNMAGWRVGALLGAKDYIDVVLRFKSNMDSGMYKAIQVAAIQALALDHNWFDSINEIYTERKKVVQRIFDVLDCRYDENTAGLFVWAKAPDYIADVPSWVDEILQKAKVFITPGFIFGSNGERYLRIALCSPVDLYKDALSRLENTIVKSIATV